MNELEKLVSKFKTQPILFVGSGLSRRYLGIDDWKGLLSTLAHMITQDAFAYRMYEDKAKSSDCAYGIFPKIGELIEIDFNYKWFSDLNFRNEHASYSNTVLNEGVSPFKAEIASYISTHCGLNHEKTKELELLRRISHKSISAIITTNYDNLLETLFPGYEIYIGQEELIFSDIKGVGEIYKIHGCFSRPSSIVLTENDYDLFSRKNSYLAAKILTLFLEHPIIFLGYSISDANIESILKEIVNCLPKDKLALLKDRMIFIEWVPTHHEEITPYTHAFEDGKSIPLTKIITDSFEPLFDALLKYTGKYDVRILRQLKEDIYDLVLTSNPVSKMRVVGLEDPKSEDIEIVIGVGVLSEFGKKGYASINVLELYEDIVLSNKDYDPNLMIMEALPQLSITNSAKLPFYKYLNEKDPEQELHKFICASIASHDELGYDYFFNNTIIKNRHKYVFTSIPEVLEYQHSIEKQIELIIHLTEDHIQLDDLEKFLYNYMKDNSNWAMLKANILTDLKRLIRLYDWMKYR